MRLLVMDRFTVAALLCVLLMLSSLQHQQSKAILSLQLLCLISENTHGCNVGMVDGPNIWSVEWNGSSNLICCHLFLGCGNIDMCYLDTFLSASTSCMIWNTQLVRDDWQIQIYACSHLPHNLRSSYEYLVHYQSEHSCSH